MRPLLRGIAAGLFNKFHVHWHVQRIRPRTAIGLSKLQRLRSIFHVDMGLCVSFVFVALAMERRIETSITDDIGNFAIQA